MFVTVNKSHWRAAPYDSVISVLRSTGKFEFSVTGMDTWTNKFVLENKNGALEVEFVINDALSDFMKQRLETMKQQFIVQARKL